MVVTLAWKVLTMSLRNQVSVNIDETQAINENIRPTQESFDELGETVDSITQQESEQANTCV